MTYYERSSAVHLDGTPIFASPEDERNQKEVASILAEHWGCEIRSFGRLAPVDWFSVRDGRVVGVLELKCRSHPSSRFPTVYLNLRKWLALMLCEVGQGVPAIFVVKFSDGVFWTPVRSIPEKVTLGGCKVIVKSRNDIEPVVEVPISMMTGIKSSSGGEE